MAECGPCRGSSAPQAQLRGVGGPSGRQHSPSPTPPAQPFRLSWFPAAPEGPAGQCVAGVGWALHPQPCQATLGLWLRETGGRPPSQAGLLAPAPRLAPNPPCLAAGTLSFRGHAQVAGGRSPCVQQTRAPPGLLMLCSPCRAQVKSVRRRDKKASVLFIEGHMNPRGRG